MNTTHNAFQSGLDTLRRLIRDDSALSAVEFSLLAPVLVVGTISTVDAGMAVYEKMMITQVLRAGAAGAAISAEEAEVMSMLQNTAAANFTLAEDVPKPGELALDVERYCICPEATGTEVACDTSCTGGPPQRFYHLSATFNFKGVMLPQFSMNGEIAVLAE